jgi:hypothetical protein
MLAQSLAEFEDFVLSGLDRGRQREPLCESSCPAATSRLRGIGALIRWTMVIQPELDGE